MNDTAHPTTATPERAKTLVGGVAERLHKTLRSAKQVEQTATLVSELLIYLFNARRNGSHAPPIKHRIRHGEGDAHFFVYVEQIEHFDMNYDAAALYRIAAQHLLGVRFQFASQTTGDPLKYGLLIMHLLVRGPTSANESGESVAERLAQNRLRLRHPYAEPAVRRPQTFPLDWSRSIVRSAADRALVLELIDDVYNMQAVMPLGLTVSLEPVVLDNYAERVQSGLGGAASKKRKKGARPDDESADASSDTATVAENRCVGYTLHFSGVPSFDDNFLDYMRHKYASRWLNAIVLFPHVRGTGEQDEELIFAPILAISLGTDQAVSQDCKPFAITGSKRLCNKIFTPDTVTVSGSGAGD